MREFLAMGGYAVWVWSAFGLTALVLAANMLAASRRYDRTLARLRSRMARSEGDFQ
jgi:heme exporter protein D